MTREEALGKAADALHKAELMMDTSGRPDGTFYLNLGQAWTDIARELRDHPPAEVEQEAAQMVAAQEAGE